MKKYLSTNLRRSMTKDLHKAIINRSRLCNTFFSNKREISCKEYKKQQDLCCNLLRKDKKKTILQNSIYFQSQTTKFSGKL